jgi:starvation-inducible outer membrane lipoprotein
MKMILVYRDKTKHLNMIMIKIIFMRVTNYKRWHLKKQKDYQYNRSQQYNKIYYHLK